MKKTINTSTTYIILACLFCTFFGQHKSHAQTCPGLSSLTLNVVSAASPILTAPTQICPGSNATLSVTQTFNSYAWNTGETSQSIDINNGGTFTVTVTNTAGCTSTAVTNVNTSPVPSPNITQNAYTCNGNITLNAGAGFSSYAWSNGGGGSQTATFGTAGDYTVTVTNAAGCTGTNAFSVTIPSPPVVDISGNLSTCSGQNTTLTATAGFSGYAWSAGGNSPSINVNTGGTFTVTVTDNFGCTDTDSETVVAQVSPVPSVAGTQICPDASTTLSVTNGPFQSYNWSSGSTINTTSATVGNYTVTVTAVNGCTGTTSANVTALPVPNPNINQAPYTCNGQITLNAGAGFASYTWSNSGSTATTTVNLSGPYTVTVTNTQGCSATDNFDVNIPTPPAVSILGDNTFCAGTSADLEATAGFSNYSWSNGQNVSSINVTVGGTFSVTVTDGFGCTATSNFSVNQLPAPQPVVTGVSSVCDGLSATFNTSNNFPAYSWSTGETSPSISLNTGGIYTVTVTAANGCTGTDSQNLSITAAPSPTITEGSYNCDDQISINAGAGFSAYNWSNGGSSATITVNISDNYTVTVTNAQGCTGTDTYTAIIPAPPSVVISGNNTICVGSSSTLSATTLADQYLWSNNSTNPTIDVSLPGNYSVTVTDGLGCTASTSFGVSALATPTTNISGPSQICATGSATFSVPGTFSAFNWSNGATTPTITVNAANTYAVTVTAANGCTNTDTQVLIIDNSLQPQITELPYTCNGQITLDAGSGFSNYQWAAGEMTQSITVSNTGTYTVTVSDAGGCTGTAVVAATLPTAPVVDINGTSNICSGAFSTLSASAGLNAYSWNTGQVGQTISVSTAGVYTVIATDAFGCTVSDDFVLTNTPAPTPVIGGPSVICISSTGTLTLNSTFAQYNWSTGASTPEISISSGNTYSVTVTDALGCTGTDAQVVTEASALSPSPTTLPYTCNATQTLDAGAGFSSYTWSSGQSTPSIIVSADGTYSVTVSDATGCTGTGTLTVTIPVAPPLAITGQISFCQNGNTSLEASAGFVNYSWNTGAITNLITVTQGGAFTVVVTDSLGCKDTASVLISVQPLPQPQIIGAAALCAGNSGTLSLNQVFTGYAWNDGTTGSSINVNTAGAYLVTVTDGNGCTGTANINLSINQNPVTAVIEAPYACDAQITLSADAGFNTYSWAGPNGFTANTQQAAVSESGTYTVTVTDANGCSGTAAQTASVPVLNQVAVAGNTSFCVGNSANLVASPGFSAYEWSNGSVLPNSTTSTAGVYTVTATDALGCSSTAALSVTSFPLPLFVISGPLAVCPGSLATLSVGGSFSNFVWNTGANTSTITVQPPFTATVTVTDANGCTGTAAASVSVSNQLSPNVVSLPYACDGQITLDAGSGFPQYSWSNAANTAVVSVTQSGTYTVTVSDGNGCSGTSSVQVNVPLLSNVAVLGPSQICTGETAQLLASSGFETYAWSNGEITSSITVSQTGNYTVSVTDAEGCVDTASLYFTVNNAVAVNIALQPYQCDEQITLDAGTGFLTYEWSNGSNAQNITILQSGLYSLTVTDMNGCSSTTTVQATIPPLSVPQVFSQPSLCEGAVSVASVINDEDYVQFNWSNGSTVFAAQGIIGGQTYTVTVTDVNGCTQTAGFTVELITSTPPSIITLPYTCNGQITLDAGAGFSQYVWVGPNGFTSNSQQPSVAITGTYTVSVSNNIACPVTAAIQVSIPTNPVVNISGDTFLCGGSSTNLTASGSAGAFAWSNGGNTAILPITQGGTYAVTLTDSNGCSATASQIVEAGTAVATTLNRSTCQTQSVGTQILTLSAANGCDSVVTIITTLLQPGLALDVATLIEASTGEVVTLNVAGNFPIDSVAFQSPFPLSCSNCVDPTFTATVSGFIQVTAFNPDGCSTSEDVEVLVRNSLNIYVPNVFEPGSTQNGYLSVFSGPEISAVRNFNVFDRWGNLMFSRKDMPTNDLTAGWDGTFRNQTMQPGVYVYYFEVLLVDGTTKLYRGDVTIVQ